MLVINVTVSYHRVDLRLVLSL